MLNPFDLHLQFESLWMAQQHAETLPVAEEELQLAEKLFEGPHPLVLRAVLDLAMASDATGDRERAQDLQNRAHEMLHALSEKAEANPDDISSAAYWMFEADRQWPIFGNENEAAALYRKAIAQLERYYGPDHDQVAEALARLAEAYFVDGKAADAEPLYRRALAIYNRDNDASAGAWKRKSVEAFARLLAEAGRPAEAVPYFERALTFYTDDVYGRQTRYFLLLGYASCLRSLGRTEQADQLERDAQTLLPKTNPGEFGFRAG